MLFFLRLLRLLFPLMVTVFAVMAFIRIVSPLLRGGGSWQQGPRYGDRGGEGYENDRSRSGGSSGRSEGPGGGPFGGAPRDPYALLGCSRSDTDDEIRRSYRKLMSRYHPDRFIAMELDEEFVELASRKMQAIREAYEEIARQRGFRPR